MLKSFIIEGKIFSSADLFNIVNQLLSFRTVGTYCINSSIIWIILVLKIIY